MLEASRPSSSLHSEPWAVSTGVQPTPRFLIVSPGKHFSRPSGHNTQNGCSRDPPPALSPHPSRQGTDQDSSPRAPQPPPVLPNQTPACVLFRHPPPGHPSQPPEWGLPLSSLCSRAPREKATEPTTWAIRRATTQPSWPTPLQRPTAHPEDSLSQRTPLGGPLSPRRSEGSPRLLTPHPHDHNHRPSDGRGLPAHNLLCFLDQLHPSR